MLATRFVTLIGALQDCAETASAFHEFASSPEERPKWYPVQDPEYSRIAGMDHGVQAASSASAAVLCSEYNLSTAW